jgi:carbamoyl-phosphate synthase large subunit
VGYTLDEIQNDITASTPASFEPTIDYVVTKIPRFTFEKFKGSEPLLSTAMKSVGEAMAIGRSFHESLQKALRSLETGLIGLDGIRELYGAPRIEIEAALARPTPDRLLVAAQALREGFTVAEIHAIAKYDPWFLDRLKEIVDAEEQVCRDGLPNEAAGMRRLKAMGFCDRRLAELALRSANIRGGGVKTRARSHGLLHDVARMMIGATTEEEVRRCATGSASGRVQADRHGGGRVRGEGRPICIRPTRRRASASRRTRASRRTAQES